MKKHISFILLVSTFLSVFSGCKPAAPKSAAPNIILFLVDDMGWQDTSVPFWNQKTPFNDRYRTPNMERLAREGMKFTQAYASSVCSPTRVSLMSGMNAARHRVTNWTLRRNNSNDAPHEYLQFPLWHMNGIQPTDSIENATYITSLPQILRDSGYYTIHIGKAHFGAIGTPGADPRNLGFDANIAGHAAGGPGSYLGLNNFSAAWRAGDRVWDIPGLEKYHGQDIFLSEALTREAIAAVETAVDRRQPFYLYMSHYAVHAPLEVDNRFYSKYIEMGLDEKEARYASMIEGMDKSLGDLMDFLERQGIADNTIVLFMSDNGGLSASGRGGGFHIHNKPLSSGKGSAHEGGIREPMLVKWPGVAQPGSVCDEYLIIEDFFPTILEMAGIRDYRTVQTVDGVSFTPLLRGETLSSQNRPLFWHFPNHWGPIGPGIAPSSTVRLGDWKLIYYLVDQSFELFNLREDIGEQNNLAESQPEKVRELAGILSEHLKAVEAQMPLDARTGTLVPMPEAAAEEL